MVVAEGNAMQPAEYTDALRERERVVLEKGFEYARKALEVGVQWRS